MDAVAPSARVVILSHVGRAGPRASGRSVALTRVSLSEKRTSFAALSSDFGTKTSPRGLNFGPD